MKYSEIINSVSFQTMKNDTEHFRSLVMNYWNHNKHVVSTGDFKAFNALEHYGSSYLAQGMLDRLTQKGFVKCWNWITTN